MNWSNFRRGERYYLKLEYKNVWILTSEIKNKKFENSLIHSFNPKIKTLSQPGKYRLTEHSGPKKQKENKHPPSESSATIREGPRREIDSEIKRDEYA